MKDDVLESGRRSVDNIDAALVHLLAERFKVTEAMGRYRSAAALTMSETTRTEHPISRLRRLARAAGVDPQFMERFLRLVIDQDILVAIRSGVPTAVRPDDLHRRLNVRQPRRLRCHAFAEPD